MAVEREAILKAIVFLGLKDMPKDEAELRAAKEQVDSFLPTRVEHMGAEHPEWIQDQVQEEQDAFDLLLKCLADGTQIEFSEEEIRILHI